MIRREFLKRIVKFFFVIITLFPFISVIFKKSGKTSGKEAMFYRKLKG